MGKLAKTQAIKREEKPKGTKGGEIFCPSGTFVKLRKKTTQQLQEVPKTEQIHHAHSSLGVDK